MAFMLTPGMAKQLNKKLSMTGTDRTASDLSIFGTILTSALTIIFLTVAFLIPSAGIKFFPNSAPGLSILVTVVFYLVLSFVISLLLAYIYVTLKIHNRKKQIENVLADYLQLVSANVDSGMPIDQALWYAVRPQFGVLSQEIEIVAKKTMTGSELDEALMEFSRKYDSDILRKSMVLLIEGLKAGGAIGDLLNKISWNIKETEIMRKEVAANVTIYTMFILFSTVVAAPLLFAVSHQLISLMTNLLSTVDIASVEGTLGQSQMPLQIQNIKITPNAFQTFVLLLLAMSSGFAALLISTVRKGNVKEGIKFLPIYILASILIFIGFRLLFGSIMGGIIT